MTNSLVRKAIWLEGSPFEPYILSSKQGAIFTGLLHFFIESLILIIVGALLVLDFIVIATGTRSTMHSYRESPS